MKILVLGGLSLLCGCIDDPGADDGYPVQGGGGVVAGTSTPGGGSGTGTGTKKPYRVCLLEDARDLTSCAATGAGGFLVTLGSATAGTQTDGSFLIDIAQGMGKHFEVTGTGMIKSLMPFGLGGFGIPMISETKYTDMLNGSGVLVVAGQGAIMTQATVAGAPAAGLVATTLPGGAYPVQYDGASETTWDTTGGTGVQGTIWAPGLAAGTGAITVTDMGVTISGGYTGLDVQDGAITFAAPAIVE